MTEDRKLPLAVWLPDDPEPSIPPPPVPGGTEIVIRGAGLGWGVTIAALAFLLGWWVA